MFGTSVTHVHEWREPREHHGSICGLLVRVDHRAVQSRESLCSHASGLVVMASGWMQRVTHYCRLDE